MPCIYKLIDGTEVVYVGKSKASPPYQRIFEHAKDKIFTSYEFFDCDSDCLKATEIDLISTLQPKYNKSHNPSYDRMTGTNRAILDELGQCFWMELQLVFAIFPETAHLSDSFKQYMDHYRSLTT